MSENATDEAHLEPEPEPWHPPEDDIDDLSASQEGMEIPEPVRPIDWNSLTAEEAEAEWRDLDEWVDWLRRTYGLPATIVPPLWHRHDELVWELSALQTHWRECYDPNSSGSAPLQWHHDFTEARARLREWVSTCGTRIDRDRPTRQTPWPGEADAGTTAENPIPNRRADFEQFLAEDAAARTSTT